MVCPPVCAIYCPNGNVQDSNGCPTCTCKPDPVDAMPIDSSVCPVYACPPVVCTNGYAKDGDGCATCKCNPDPTVCPAIKCKACPFGYLEDSNGCDTCNCAPDPGSACPDLTSETACTAAGTRCRWLVRGCSEPALPASGCYDKTLIDCTSTCPSGTTCLPRSIDPCYNLDCRACGQTVNICL